MHGMTRIKLRSYLYEAVMKGWLTRITISMCIHPAGRVTARRCISRRACVTAMNRHRRTSTSLPYRRTAKASPKTSRALTRPGIRHLSSVPMGAISPGSRCHAPASKPTSSRWYCVICAPARTASSPKTGTAHPLRSHLRATASRSCSARASSISKRAISESPRHPPTSPSGWRTKRRTRPLRSSSRRPPARAATAMSSSWGPAASPGCSGSASCWATGPCSACSSPTRRWPTPTAGPPLPRSRDRGP